MPSEMTELIDKKLYGLYIRPSTYCQLLDEHSSMQMVFTPGIDYTLPTISRDAILIPIPQPRPSTGEKKREVIETKPEHLMQRFQQAREFFQGHKPELLKKYPGKWIAIWENQVVDFDEDDQALAIRVYKKLGYLPILITKVTAKPRAVELPSPEARR